MRDDAALLVQIDAAFGNVPKPEHFTDFMHCEECAEHDRTLRENDRSSLGLAHLGNPGWDPLCFCSAEGIAYYFPTLARLTLNSQTESDWYATQLLFHLTSGGSYNQCHQSWNRLQHEAVSSLLGHLLETRSKEIESYGSQDEFLNGLELWRGAA